MFARRLVVEDLDFKDWRSSHEILDPSWQDIQTAIQRMDGRNRSTLSFGAGDFDEGFMGIGGGDGQYVCFVIASDGTETNLVNAQETSDDTVRIFMGQTSIRAKREVVDLKTVLDVASTFAKCGTLDERYHWTGTP